MAESHFLTFINVSSSSGSKFGKDAATQSRVRSEVMRNLRRKQRLEDQKSQAHCFCLDAILLIVLQNLSRLNWPLNLDMFLLLASLTLYMDGKQVAPTRIPWHRMSSTNS